MKPGKIAMGVGFVALAAAAIVFGVMWQRARSENAAKLITISQLKADLENEWKISGEHYHRERAFGAALNSLMSQGSVISVQFDTRGPITISKAEQNLLVMRFSEPYPSYTDDSFDLVINGSSKLDLRLDQVKVDMGELSGVAEKSALRQAIGQFALAFMAGKDALMWNNPDYVRLWDAMLGKETTIGFEYDAVDGTGTLKIPVGGGMYHYMFSTWNRDYVLKVLDAEGNALLEFLSKEEFSSEELPQ